MPQRGLPLGYLIKAEERLAETEAALLAALSLVVDRGLLPHLELAGHLRTSDSGATRPSKAERTQEWEKFPLRTREELMGWYHVRSQSFDEMRRDTSLTGFPQPCIAQDPDTNPRSSKVHSKDSDVLERGSPSVPSPEAGSRPDTVTSGMAEALTKSKKHMYF